MLPLESWVGKKADFIVQVGPNVEEETVEITGFDGRFIYFLDESGVPGGYGISFVIRMSEHTPEEEEPDAPKKEEPEEIPIVLTTGRRVLKA